MPCTEPGAVELTKLKKILPASRTPVWNPLGNRMFLPVVSAPACSHHIPWPSRDLAAADPVSVLAPSAHLASACGGFSWVCVAGHLGGAPKGATAFKSQARGCFSCGPSLGGCACLWGPLGLQWPAGTPDVCQCQLLS